MLKIRNYRCFGNDAQGFDCLPSLTLLVGKNSAGKSALIDLIQHAAHGNASQFPPDDWHQGAAPAIVEAAEISESHVDAAVAGNISGGDLPGAHRAVMRAALVGERLTWFSPTGDPASRVVAPDQGAVTEHPHVRANNGSRYLAAILKKLPRLTDGFRVLRLRAERDTKPEPLEATHGTFFAENGDGITALIAQHLHRSDLDESLIEEHILQRLNGIIGPELKYERISAQKSGQDWEVYLQEPGRRRVALSRTGSGLKTILLTLCLCEAGLDQQARGDQKYIYCIEEPENHLHPEALRNLLAYLIDVSQRGHRVVVATHSPIAIDAWARLEDAQTLHVSRNHSEGTAEVKRVESTSAAWQVLDDLGSRPSDVLQANSAVWVEGPSDRILLRRWIDIMSEGTLVEGVHYQIMFYGGRLLSRLTAEPDAAASDLIEILTLNRHAILVVDSDKGTDSDEIAATKKRMMRSIESAGGLAWLTWGREIENYIHKQVLEAAVDSDLPEQPARYADVFEALSASGAGNWRSKKLELARRSAEATERQHMEIGDLPGQVSAACELIHSWSGIAPTPEH